MSGHGDSSLTAVVTAVAVNFVITIAKYVGWVITLSPSLLAEAIHSTADVGNQVLLWIGIRQSAKAATPRHPYGWGAARYLWNLKSAMGIFFLGCGATLYHGVHEAWELVAHPDHFSHDAPHPVGLWILAGSFVLEVLSLVVALKAVNSERGDTPLLEFMRQGDDPTGVGVILEDGAAVLGVALALLGVWLRQVLHTPVPDIVATLLIGLLMGVIAVFLAKANGRLLIGASIPEAEERRLLDALAADEVVEHVEDLKTEVLGHGRVRVKLEVALREDRIADKMRARLQADAGRLAAGEEPLGVLTGVVGGSVRLAATEIQRLDRKVREVVPDAAHVDLELIEPTGPAPGGPGAASGA
jgi:zinc transporter 9